jgi:hypothetical protein
MSLDSATASADPISSAIESAVSAAHPEAFAEGGAASDPSPASDDTGPDALTPEAAAAPLPTTDDPAAKPADDDEEAQIAALEKELVAKTPTLRGKIGVSRHQAVLTRTRNKMEAEHKAAVEALTSKYSKYDAPDVAERLNAMALIEANPQAGVEFILNHPKYKDAAEAIIQSRLKAIAPPTAASEVPETMPEPDVVMPDGNLGYSAKGARALAAWEAKQVETRMGDKFKEYEGALKPIREEREARARYDARVAELKPRVDRLRGFQDLALSEHEPALNAYLEANPKATLEEAALYGVVPKVIEKLRANATAMREQILAEVRADLGKVKAPPQRAEPATKAPSAAVDDDVDPIEAAIRASIAGQK